MNHDAAGVAVGHVKAVAGSTSTPKTYKFTPTGARKAASLLANFSHVHYPKDNTNHSARFDPMRYGKNRIYKASQPAWKYARDMRKQSKTKKTGQEIRAQ